MKKRSPCPSPGEFIRNGKRYVRIITHDLVRDVLVPTEEANSEGIVFSKEDLFKIANNSEHVEDSKKNVQERIQKAKESEKRKEEMFRLSKKIVNIGPKLDELEMKASLKSKYLYERAQEFRKEQEDVIKMCNGLILSKKCQAIRDAQIAEKKLLQKELLEEEKRKDKYMEDERLKDLQSIEIEKRKIQLKKNEFIKDLKDQIEYNEKQRALLAEIMGMEARMADKVAMKVKMEEAACLKEKLKKQQKLKAEMIRVNEELKCLAEQERMKQSIIDLRIQEFVRQKAEQEIKREEGIIKAKKEKAKQMAQFRKGYEKYENNRATKEHMLILKLQDEVEKKWRNQEKESAMRRAKLNETLHLERKKQIEERRKFQAIEIERQRMEREEMAQLYSQVIEKEKEEEEKRRLNTETYRLALLKQISDKENERQREKQETFQDAMKQTEEIEEREQELKKLMRKKMELMRKHNVPEKYVKEIEQKLHLF